MGLSVLHSSRSGIAVGATSLCLLLATMLSFSSVAGALGGTETHTAPGSFTFTVPAGAEVIQATAVGGAGGNGSANPGAAGLGCRVTASVAVNPSDIVTGFVGSAGTTPSGSSSGDGGAGLAGSGAGGNGNGPGNQGGGGGGSYSALLDGTVSTLIAAGGGGGANGGYAGGSACALDSPAGANGGFGFNGGRGATLLSSGGAGGGNTNQGPGDPGSSYALGGSGGAGATTDSGGGAGGGGGASGGGGGDSGDDGPGSGGAGLSYVTTTSSSLLSAATYAPSSSVPSVTISYISFAPSTLTNATAGVSYSATLSATFGSSIAVSGSNAHWSISPALPGGLTLDSSTGVINGTPTTNSPATPYTFTAEEMSGSLIVAESSMTLSLTVSSSSVATTTTIATTSLPNTGSNLLAPGMIGLTLLGLGTTGIVMGRRRRNTVDS